MAHWLQEASLIPVKAGNYIKEGRLPAVGMAMVLGDVWCGWAGLLRDLCHGHGIWLLSSVIRIFFFFFIVPLVVY